ncbi:MAG: flagellar hook-basal body complex protein [Lachnospiraceae bacterium]|nr:flagellar hook-basal body complex protein [Lachnospiraceae bacterium]
MMRSLFSGVSGLKVHQTKMDVIGNNIANVNTTSYKSMSINFSELMYQTSANASGPNATTGTAGKNPKQIGLGVVSGAISTAITSAGSAQTTNNPFDIRISGDAFFIVSNGSDNLFTRDGSFYVDAAGNLAMTSTGYNVMGWQVDAETGKVRQDTVTALRIMSQENMTYDAEYTTNGNITGIVDKKDTDINSTAGKTINLPIFDNLGYSYTVKLSLHKATNDGEFYLEMDDILDSEQKSISEYYGVPIDQIARLGAQSDVNVQDAYNPLTDTFNITVTDDGGNRVETPVTRSVTYDQATRSYKVSFMDDTGTIINNTTPTGYMDAIKAAGIDVDALGAAQADGTYLVPLTNFAADPTGADADPDAVRGLDTTTIQSNLAALQVIFGEDINQAVKGATLDPLTGTLTVTDKTIQGGLIRFNTDTGAFISANGNPTGLTIDFAEQFTNANNVVTSLRNFHDIEIDMTRMKSSDNGGSASLAADSGDLNGLGAGRKLGDMSGIQISDNGEIWAAYDNGMSRLLGQIAVAEFANPSGLEKVGDNLYNKTLNSGDFDGIGVDIKVNGGAMNSGQLEMSNVDLSTEFTEMITTQRGFQANSRIITTSDSLLEELVNLKR